MKNKTASITIAPDHLDTIVADIKGLLQNKNDFVAFVVLVIGIEFLGSFIDTEDFEKEKMSEIRFKNGLGLFKGTKGHWYRQNKVNLYKQLRSNLIHQYRPGDMFYLTSIKVSNASKNEHLKDREGKIVLVLECFLEEFEKAVGQLRKNFKVVKQKKREEEYFVVKSIPKEEIKSGINSLENITIINDESTSSTNNYQVSGNTE